MNKVTKLDPKCEENDHNTEETEKENTLNARKISTATNGALKCIGLLPGIGYYKDSSDSGSTSSSEDDCETDKCCQLDFVGRKVCKSQEK